MRIQIGKLRKNPYRDFDLYPLDDEQIVRLSQSMTRVGMFPGISARPDPTEKGFYQIAAGHHRSAAAELAGLTEVEVNVENYSDEQMVEVMALENLAQRGYSASAILDAVAAYSRIIAKDVLLGDGGVTKVLVTLGAGALEGQQALIAKVGPGNELLYRAMNGFAKDERSANKKVENVKETDIQNALNTLKQGGVMGKLVAEVHAEVEVIRAEREATERAEREAELQRIADAEQAAAARKKAEKKAKAEVERHEREREAVAAQAAEEAIYDIRCASFFKERQERAFREAILTPGAREVIGKDDQLGLAKLVSAEVEKVSKQRGSAGVGAQTVRAITRQFVDHAIRTKLDMAKKERERLLAESMGERVRDRWKTIRRGMLQAEAALINLIEDEKAWPYHQAPFPMDMEVIRRVTEVGRRFADLQEALKSKRGTSDEEGRPRPNGVGDDARAPRRSAPTLTIEADGGAGTGKTPSAE